MSVESQEQQRKDAAWRRATRRGTRDTWGSERKDPGDRANGPGAWQEPELEVPALTSIAPEPQATDKQARRIRWEDSRYTGKDGYAGTLASRVFTISWGIRRNDPKPWKLRSTLPGWTSQVYDVASVEEGQALAERVLTAFIRKISAASPDEKGNPE